MLRLVVQPRPCHGIQQRERSLGSVQPCDQLSEGTLVGWIQMSELNAHGHVRVEDSNHACGRDFMVADLEQKRQGAACWQWITGFHIATSETDIAQSRREASAAACARNKDIARDREPSARPSVSEAAAYVLVAIRAGNLVAVQCRLR